MQTNKPNKSDVEIANDFEQLFDEIPEPESDADIAAYLLEAGYDKELLKRQGAEFIANLMASNWRFVSSSEIEAATKRIDEVPLRKNWDHSRLTTTIEKVSKVLALSGRQPAMAFRNLEELTDADLAVILQELEYKALVSGVDLEID